MNLKKKKKHDSNWQKKEGKKSKESKCKTMKQSNPNSLLLHYTHP